MDILMFCFTDKWFNWNKDGFPSRSSIIAKKLSGHPCVRKLLIVNVPSSIFSLAGGTPGKVIRKGMFFTLRQVYPKAYTLDHRRLLPRERHYPVMFKLNNLLHNYYFKRLIQYSIEAIGIKHPIIWHNGPLTVNYSGRFGERLTVYDAVDEWLYHPGFQRMKREIDNAYKTIKQSANIIFAVSESLVNTFSDAKGRVLHMPNAVKVEAFNSNEYVVPDDIRLLRRPIVGYVGALQERVDVDLLFNTAKAIPEASFVLVGPILSSEHFEPLRSLKNVHLLGRKKHGEIPQYLRSFDVCIMPHIDCDLTRNMDPLKLYEYIAAEKPIISTNIPTLNRFDGLMKIASSTTEFIDYILGAINGEWTPQLEVTREFIDKNTWDSRINSIIEVITTAIGGTEKPTVTDLVKEEEGILNLVEIEMAPVHMV